jgi:hypothetical protein
VNGSVPDDEPDGSFAERPAAVLLAPLVPALLAPVVFVPV